MTFLAIVILLWLLPTLIFIAAAMVAVPGAVAIRGFRRAARRIFARGGDALSATVEVGR